MALRERLTAPGPKRILALDGGGIRGALTLGYLERMETLLRDRHGNPELRLADYFDLIGGTSTGSIIAAGLAIGLSATEIKELYLELGGQVFGKSRMGKIDQFAGAPILAKYQFEEAPLQEQLQNIFGDMTLGSDKILTGLCIVTKRADTRSTWPLINHPDGRYYGDNSVIPLRNAIRASTAAPTYFVPEKLEVKPGQTGLFWDGGVSMANNPALQLFLIATLQGFPFRWKSGGDNLLLVSVGTGTWRVGHEISELKPNLAKDARRMIDMLMEDASNQNQVMLQMLSNSPTAWQIDREIGDLSGDVLSSEPALSYLRYDEILEPWALEELGLGELSPRAALLHEMSEADNRHDLARIGAASAQARVHAAHFPATFDLSR